ncbi:PREDICTED: protein FANTASTIC FOUR 1-like [Camelina sativa]|uniref:Protein FANTASTIC FOUR 1-like n=1 Tax=Camelina sativa TaxID=90675 RepID=A0ABM0TS29_CAMSA|nr:PREDICTED: protein FANTASTIC FOUR 1-like [Camelina sativa]
MSAIFGQAYQHLPKKQVSQNADSGGWSFLQCLSETKGIFQNREDDVTKKTAYVHPIEKRSVAKLSLEMCTESLGTENGSDSGDEISLLAFEGTNTSIMSPHTAKPQKETNLIVTRENSFPPPLKSVNGFNNRRMVRSYKEDGRLVVQAIRVCPPPRCFVSERCEGRLRLCLSENSSLSHDGDEDQFEENESDIEAHEEDEDEEKGEEDYAEDEEEEQEEEEGIMGNNDNFEVKTGKKKFSRRPKRRCHENGCEPTTMLNWKPNQFWVTT